MYFSSFFSIHSLFLGLIGFCKFSFVIVDCVGASLTELAVVVVLAALGVVLVTVPVMVKKVLLK